MYKMLWDSLNPGNQIDRMALVHCKKNFKGAKPTARTKLFKEVKFDKVAVESALNLYYRYEEAFDKQGV